MTEADPLALAMLHAAAFADEERPSSNLDRAWSSAEFMGLLRAPEVFVETASTPTLAGFAVGRVAADEAELLTIAVAPEARRRGIGRALLAGVARTAAGRGATRLFLEVRVGNNAARGLYAHAGFVHVGRRAAYYGADGDALVLCKELAGRFASA